MARLARIVIPGIPHHVTQRGNRRQKTFFSPEDFAVYRDLLGEHCRAAQVEIWAYCLMPNHVHLILVPADEDGLRRALGETHRRYTRRVNFREGWRGHLWQERFHSFPMDQSYLIAAARYVELNPVRAGLVKQPDDWEWSSAKTHLTGVSDGVVDGTALQYTPLEWQTFLNQPMTESMAETLRASERTGRPLGSDDFVDDLQRRSGRVLKPGKRGPKFKTPHED
jgi:putative transposase